MNTDTSDNSTVTAAGKYDGVTEPDEDGMLPEYDFDYTLATPNPYAGKITSCSRSVTLAPDVAAIFADSDAVNAALRALIQAAHGHVPQAKAPADTAP